MYAHSNIEESLASEGRRERSFFLGAFPSVDHCVPDYMHLGKRPSLCNYELDCLIIVRVRSPENEAQRALLHVPGKLHFVVRRLNRRPEYRQVARPYEAHAVICPVQARLRPRAPGVQSGAEIVRILKSGAFGNTFPECMPLARQHAVDHRLGGGSDRHWLGVKPWS